MRRAHFTAVRSRPAMSPRSRNASLKSVRRPPPYRGSDETPLYRRERTRDSSMLDSRYVRKAAFWVYQVTSRFFVNGTTSPPGFPPSIAAAIVAPIVSTALRSGSASRCA